ncbi:MAG TPA: hypothetical protein PLG75_01225 [Methanoculleus sp.]|nr:hypothetical protein [Methanoculleus sp.]
MLRYESRERRVGECSLSTGTGQFPVLNARAAIMGERIEAKVDQLETVLDGISGRALKSDWVGV